MSLEKLVQLGWYKAEPSSPKEIADLFSERGLRQLEWHPAPFEPVRFRQKVGGGGGSRTRVRNRCQPRESMLSPVPMVSLATLRTDKMRCKLVRWSRGCNTDREAATSLLNDVLLAAHRRNRERRQLS
jgi:hypothetical protein